MSDTRQIPVFGREGRLGWIEPGNAGMNAAEGEDEGLVLVRLENGTLIQAPADLLVQQEDGSYYLPMSASQFEGASGEQREHLMVIPVVVEEAQVSKRRTTRRVRVHKSVRQREEVVDETGFQEEVRVERVPVNQFVESAPKARQEGNTLIIPVLEEVLVVEKRLVLKEEVRVTRQRHTTRSPQRVTLRSEEVQVERLEPEEEPTLGDPRPGETKDPLF